MTKILIPHSWSLNMGDTAILLATVKMLSDIAPHSEITALVSHPEFTKERCPHINARLEGWPWPTPDADRIGVFDLVQYPFILLSNFISAIAYRLFKARIFIFNKKFSRALSSFFDCDVVISPGGGYIGPHYWFVTTFSEFLISKILGKKLVICTQTIGPFKGLLNGRMAAWVLNLVDLIVVREKQTASQLERIGVRNVHTTTDVAFAFPKTIKQSSAQGKKIIICAKRLQQPVQREIYANQLRKLTERIMDEFDCEVLYLPTDKYDVEFQSELISEMPGKVRQIEEVHPPDKIAEIISEADFLISSRMHAMILGSLSSTPFYAIGDSFKFEGVLGNLCENCSMNIQDFDEKGIDNIAEQIRDAKRLRKRISDRLPFLKKKAMENSLILSKKFQDWGIVSL
jgi:colanic acid/amylovoran biosynthesis protein